mgnify:CR=1 FL=1
MKETVMQFGEGGFLRGFVDYFFKKLNDAGVYEGKVVVIQPIDKGMVNMLNDQNCEYNLYLRGLQNGKEVIELLMLMLSQEVSIHMRILMHIWHWLRTQICV